MTPHATQLTHTVERRKSVFDTLGVDEVVEQEFATQQFEMEDQGVRRISNAQPPHENFEQTQQKDYTNV